MRRHYLKIPTTIQCWFPGGAPHDWKTRAFDDATEKGTRLVFQALRPNAEGPRAAVYGDEFYFEVGRDRDRPDTLFVTRIEAPHELTAVPQSLNLEIRLWPGGSPPVLDRVDDIFGIDPAADPEPEVVLAAPPTEPSHLLMTALSEMPAEVRERLRPSAGSPAPKELLAPLRGLWSRHRLDRLIEPTARQIAFLRGVIQPTTLDESETEDLLALFGFNLLNRLAAGGPEARVELERLIRGLSDVPDPPTKLAIWSAMLAKLDGPILRRELFDSREGLQELSAASDTRTGRVCRLLLVPTLLSAARKDPPLLRLLQGSYPDATVLAAIAEWAGGLDFAAAEPKADEAPVPLIAHPLADRDTRTQLIDRWVLRLRGLGRDQVNAETREIRSIINRATTALDDADSIAGLTALLGAVDQLRVDADGWLERLPDPKDLANDRDEADAALAGAEQLLGADAFDFIESVPTLTPKELQEVAALLSNVEMLQMAPAWLWNLDSSESQMETPVQGIEMARRLSRPAVRMAMRTFGDCLTRLGQPMAARWLPPLPASRSPEEHLLEWYDKAQEFLVEVPPEIQQVLRSEGSDGADLTVLLSNVGRVTQLRDGLGVELTAELMAPLLVLPAEELAVELDALIRAVDFFRASIGSLEDLDAKIIRKRVEKDRGDRKDRVIEASVEPLIAVDHNWTDANNAKATLTLRKAADGAAYGEIAAPLVLETAQPSAVSVEIDWQVKGKLREAWPDEWPDIDPSEPVSVYPQDWRPNPGGGYLHTFTATFPVRIPRSERLSRLEVVASVKDHRNGRILSDPKNLRWEQVEDRHRDVVVQWADATNPDYIRDHPIGPQEKFKTILLRLQGGSSVAVIAPRRFGKSTLAEYLTSEAADAGLVMTSAIWCTEFWSLSGFDYPRLWDHASNQLKALLGAEIGSGRQGYLPSPEAFDHVRKVAHEKGFKAVVLLFDEAQLFFPAHGAHELSSMVKMLLERHWARAEKGKVPLLMAFVGLPSMRQRVGADLMGLLNPIERSSMDESELKPLIGHMVKGLQTTREARQRLAIASGNLFILRALLERLKDYVNKEQRRWASYGDVFDVEESLRRDLQRALPESETVAAYVRDILNEAERVEDWKPVPAFPVAVAIAQERQAGRSWSEVEHRVAEVLNQWCSAIADEDVRPTYDVSIVAEHIQLLRERGVLRDEEFSSRLLEAWLMGIGSRTRLGLSEAFKEALLRGAQRRILIPEGNARVATGGQAEIIRHGDVAFRIKLLSSEADRQHYLESVRVLECVKDIWTSREPGSDHIFEPIDIGLSVRNSSEAVQKYRWVEGRDLSDRGQAVSAEAVVDIGAKLARAVSLLHKNNILHRDISPRNVIVADTDAESLRPVLIDFGFARMAEGPTATVFLSEHLAPEVRTRPAMWSKAADVYGLASTLKWLLAPSAQSEAVLNCLNRAMVEKPEARPDIGTFVVDLEALSESFSLDQRQEAAWHAIQQKLGRDMYSAWIPKVIRQNRSTLVGLSLGFNQDYFDRCRSIADFLNKAAETCPIRTARLRNIEARLTGDEAQAMAFVQALRHDRSHGEDVKYANTRKQVDDFRGLPKDHQRQVLLIASRRVSKACQFQSLEALVTLLLDGAA